MPSDHAGPIALLSSASAAHLDDDLPLLVSALAELGIEARVEDWHDVTVSWSTYELVVVRSPWDYTTQLDSFLAVLAQIDAATVLANPLDVIRWNVDKRYLLQLAAAGVDIVPTEAFAPGDRVRIPAGVACVVKPTVSAGARDTERYGPDQAELAAGHATALLDAGRHVLVQPYVDGIDEAGETGLVHVSGAFSHAFRKGPILRSGAEMVEGLYRDEAITSRSPSAAERDAAERVLDSLEAVLPGCDRADLLYARIDLVPGPAGPLLMELELVEPSLFLPTDPTSPARVAAAIAAHVERLRTGR